MSEAVLNVVCPHCNKQVSVKLGSTLTTQSIEQSIKPLETPALNQVAKKIEDVDSLEWRPSKQAWSDAWTFEDESELSKKLAEKIKQYKGRGWMPLGEHEYRWGKGDTRNFINRRKRK